MSPSVQIQLGFELAKIFPFGRMLDKTYTGFVSLLRDFRKSGSDFLVEEEMADIFGRGRINKDVEDQFKAAVVKDGKMVGIRRSDGKDTGIVLDSFPGATLQRAMTSNPSEGYLATVIQISLLTWMHGREYLASCISQCMEARYQAGVPGASDNSGVEAIHAMLDACSSQTGAFQWNSYVHRIEQRVAQTFQNFQHQADFTTLRPKLLLACMDYLYILQRLPENRRLVISSQHGFVTLIIWAHYCLDLSVLVYGVPGGDVFFGSGLQSSAQVLIKWTPAVETETEVSLYDSDMHLVLTPDDLEQSRIEACERLPLEDFGSTLMWRWLNTELRTAKGSDLYNEAIQYVLALAIAKLPYLVRFSWDGGEEAAGQLQIHRWQIYQVAKVMFASSTYSEAEIESYVQKLDGRQPFLAMGEPPLQLANHGAKIHRSPGRPIPVQMSMMRLSVLVIVLGSVVGIQNCGQLPILADINWLETVGSTSSVMAHKGPHVIKDTDLYYSVAQMMVGGYEKFLAEEAGSGNTSFMISEYGWTVFLSSVGPGDPSLAVPEHLFVQKGVPTKESTQERKFRVRDAAEDDLAGGMMPIRQILDRGTSYIPRCVEHVVKRVEYYATTRNDFRLSIRHCVELRTSDSVDSRFNIYKSFRAFHEGLWQSLIAPPCVHPTQDSQPGEPVALPPGVAAGTGLDWADDEPGMPDEPERICIALVKDDPNTRWLTVAMSGRMVMIRGRDTCVRCAVESAAEKSGKWLVVI